MCAEVCRIITVSSRNSPFGSGSRVPPLPIVCDPALVRWWTQLVNSQRVRLGTSTDTKALKKEGSCVAHWLTIVTYCHLADTRIPSTLFLSSLRTRMHVITRKRLNEFADTHPETRSSLAHWYQSMRTTTSRTLRIYARLSRLRIRWGSSPSSTSGQ